MKSANVKIKIYRAVQIIALNHTNKRNQEVPFWENLTSKAFFEKIFFQSAFFMLYNEPEMGYKYSLSDIEFQFVIARRYATCYISYLKTRCVIRIKVFKEIIFFAPGLSYS